ncbi:MULTISPECIES: TerB family tellurite resistance protein [Rhodomicrobium]|uniref:tellurite resistance TerB family protein n=1 Tax=Rhodomicrobium TaxID=1068 RepID=UPI000B4A9B50|nr:MULTISPECIES: TerB family tellurite resistance protein [Rhodomicrobium]
MFKSIAAFLDGLSERQDSKALAADEVQLAVAALLFHAVAIDGTVREDEMGRLKPLLASHYNLDEAGLNRLLTQAQQRERESVDIFRFTSVLRDRLSPEEKREIIGMMWRAVYADGELTALEDNLIWRTAELLAVPARERMEMKQIVRAEYSRA